MREPPRRRTGAPPEGMEGAPGAAGGRPLRRRPRPGRRTMPRAQQHTNRAAPRDEPSAAAAGPARTASRLPEFAFPFVVLSLVALAVLPPVLQRETREIRIGRKSVG